MRRMTSTKDSLRKSASAIMLLLLLLPTFWTISNPNPNATSTTITSQKAPDETVTVKPITNGNFTSNANGWSFTKSGNNPSDMSGAWTSGGYTGGAVYASLIRKNRQAVGDWYQDWPYSGTPQVVSAVLTFRWRCVTYSYPGSNNTISVLIEPPGGSPIRVWYQPLTSTTSWSTLQSVNIASIIAAGGTGTYRIILRYYGTTGASSSAQVQTRWDDVGISITYTVEFSPSDLSVVINNNADYTNNPQVSLSLQASGADQMSFRNENNATWSAWESFGATKQWVLSSGDGNKTVYFKAKNTAGESASSASDSIIYDGSTPPAPKLQSPTNGTAVNNNAPTFSWSTVTDNGTSGLATYSLDYSNDKTFVTGVTTVSVPSGTTSYTPSSLADGTWYWRVKAIDNAGNAGPYNGTNWFVVIDTVYPPGPTLTSPPTGSVTKINSVTFTWDLSQDPSPSSGIASYTLQYSQDPNFVSNVTMVSGLTGTSNATPALIDGTWYWRVRAIDRAGNQGSYSGYWSIVIDTAPPSQPTLVSPGNGTQTKVNTPALIWNPATDGTSGVANYTLQYSQDPTFVTGNTTLPGLTDTSYSITSALSDDTWYWRVGAVDRAGNPGIYSGVFNLLVDTSGPTAPSLISPTDGSSTGDNTPSFNWTVAADSGSGVGSYTLELDTSLNFDTINKTTITGLVGNHTLATPLGDDIWYWHVKAVDNVLNTGSWSSTWNLTIDTKIPGAPTLLAPVNGHITNNNTQTFGWSNVSATTYDFYIDKSPAFDTGDLKTYLGLTNFSKVVRNLSDGNWYWKVIAQRTGGSNSSTTWGIIIDTVAPGQPALTSPGDGTNTNVNTTTFTWGAATDPAPSSGIASYTLQLDTSTSFNNATGKLRTITGITILSYSVPGGSPLSDGTWYWHVKATDNAGNSGSYSGYWNFTVDTQPPTGLTLSPVDGIYTNSLTITLSITANGAQKMCLSSDGIDWVEYDFALTKPWNLTAGDGVKNVYFKCRDAAGNWAYLSGGFISITLDTVPPTAGLPSVPAYGSITSNNKTTFQWAAGSDGDGSGIASYSLQFDTTTAFSSANLTAISGLTGTSHTLATALKDGTWYWRINATDKAENTGYYSTYSKLIIDTIPPGKVSSLGLLPVNNSLLGLVSPQFGWNLVTGSNRYHIQIDRYLNFSSSYLIENLTLFNNRFNPSADNNETLTDGTWYWRVEAISLAGAHSGHSFVGAFIIDVTPPSNPQPLSPPQQGATKVTYQTPFAWSLVPDAVSYWIQLDSTQYFNSTELMTFTNMRGTSCITNVTLSYGFWYWRVVALDAAGNIADLLAAQADQFIVDTINPSPPTLRSPQQGYLSNQSTPTLAWYAASDPTFGGVSSGVANYSLWLDNSSSFNSGNLRNITGLTGASYTVASPLSDGTWNWFVNATDRAGNTGQGSVALSFTIDTVAPAPPQISSMNPNGGSLGVSKVTLTWNASSDPSGIAGYMIQLDTSSGFDSPDRLDYRDVGITTLTTDRELRNGQWYWRVAAIDRAGNLGAWSEPVPFTVNVVSGLSPIMVMMIGGGSSGAIIIAILGYIMYRKARIPFVIKKIDQSIKLISKGEMPQPVPMRARTEIVEAIFQGKLAILSKEKKEELEKKAAKAQKVTEVSAIPEERVSEEEHKTIEETGEAEPSETDVDLIAKELERLESKLGKEPSEPTEPAKGESEEPKETKKKKDDAANL